MPKMRTQFSLLQDTSEYLRRLAVELGLYSPVGQRGPTISGAIDWLGKQVEKLGAAEFVRRVRGE